MPHLPLDQEMSYPLFRTRIPIFEIVLNINGLSSSSMPPALTEAIDSSVNWPELVHSSPIHLRGDFVGSRHKERNYRIV